MTRTFASKLVLLALLWLVSCSGNPSQQDTPAKADLGFGGVPSLAEIARQGSGASDEFLIQQRGADYAADLATNRCIVSSDKLLFDPNWPQAGAQLTDAAFAVYRLTFDPLITPVTLSLEWDIAPLAGDCWIGVSNWEHGRWEWIQPSAASEIELTDPANYVNGEQHCYVTVLVLGDTLSSLTKLGFGEPPPPVPTGDGYTLIAPLMSKDTYLVDMDGTTVHTWTSNYNPGASAILTDEGHLIRSANLTNPHFQSGGAGGRIVEFDWDNTVLWYYERSNTTEVLHHDFTRLPNGNLLAIMWHKIPNADAIDAGRDPDTLTDSLWAEKIIEIEPVLPSGGNIVWEWNVMDHLIQDFDLGKGNPGNPSQHPELVDLNFPGTNAGDWLHFNCIAYNAELDQIVLSVPNFNEIWIIDHSTTTAEAAGHSGGLYGRGGDLLYRWGNPLAYRRGTAADQTLFFQHSSHWISDGLDGAGDILIFNNQAGEKHSTVVQITPPVNPDGTYFMDGNVYGPQTPTWEYIGNPPESCYSAVMSSAQRLPGGDTLICASSDGYNFVVDQAGVVKWEYTSAINFRALRYTYDHPGISRLLDP